MNPVVGASIIATVLTSGAFGQTAASIDGDWDGALTVPAGIKVPLLLHIHGATATMDSPDQNAKAVPIELQRNAEAVVIRLPKAGAEFDGVLSPDGKTMSGPFRQGGMTMQASFTLRAPGAAVAGPDRPQTPHAPFPYTARDVTFTGGDGVTLAGTLTQPKGSGPFPAVVMIAGSGPQNRDETVDGHRLFLVIADRLTRDGIAVLRYDKRGVGASKGDYATATRVDFAADAEGAFRWLAAQPKIAAGKVGLIGHSEGAEIAPTVANRDWSVDFVVLLSAPALPGVGIIVAQQRAIALAMGTPVAKANAASELERKILDAVRRAATAEQARTAAEAIMVGSGMPAAQAAAQAREVGSPWFRAFLDDDPAPALRRLRTPVLVVDGSKDLQVLPSMNLPIIRAALRDKPDATIVEIPGLNHLLQPATTGAPQEYGAITTTISPAVLDLVSRWIAERTR
jgi:pimeloyl-ACP methyl ester carboxylesterase